MVTWTKIRMELALNDYPLQEILFFPESGSLLRVPVQKRQDSVQRVKLNLLTARAGAAAARHADPPLHIDFHMQRTRPVRLSEEYQTQMHFVDQEMAYDRHTLLVDQGMAHDRHTLLVVRETAYVLHRQFQRRLGGQQKLQNAFYHRESL